MNFTSGAAGWGTSSKKTEMTPSCLPNASMATVSDPSEPEWRKRNWLRERTMPPWNVLLAWCSRSTPVPGRWNGAVQTTRACIWQCLPSLESVKVLVGVASSVTNVSEPPPSDQTISLPSGASSVRFRSSMSSAIETVAAASDVKSASLPFTHAVGTPDSFVQLTAVRSHTADSAPVHVNVSACKPPAHASATARAAPSLCIPLRAIVVFMSIMSFSF